MGCTIVLLLIKGLNFWYAHTGDSRLYLARGEALNQLTKDHSGCRKWWKAASSPASRRAAI